MVDENGGLKGGFEGLFLLINFCDSYQNGEFLW